eukprot:7837336-Ditylum_brightwellii.AAC.1
MVMTSALTHTEARMYYYSCYCKSVGHVLGQSFFLQEDLNEIEGKAIRSFKSKMGFNRNMVHVICEGPYQYGGAAITSMVDIQGIEQIKISSDIFEHLVMLVILYILLIDGLNTRQVGIYQ